MQVLSSDQALDLSAPTIAPAKLGVWTRLGDWADDAGEAKRRTREANLFIFDEQWKKTVASVRNLAEFPPCPVIVRPGWTVPHFALPTGEVLSPQTTEPAVVLFSKTPRPLGDHDITAWLDGVSRLSTGQSVVTFALMIAFASPLLALSRVTFNPGFELTGPKRKGKSTLQQLVASVVGSVSAQDGRSYIVPANTTANALEETTQGYADLPLIIEEMGQYYAGENEKARSRKMLELIMRLASGTVKARRGEPQPSPARFMYLTSSNETLSSIFGGHLDPTRSAAGDRLLTTPVSAKRKLGIFDRLPPGCRSSREAIHAMTDLAEAHFGTAMRAFLPRLVAERAADEAALKHRIQTLIDEFRRAVGVDDNIGSDSRIADVYGLVYAGGALAQNYDALPAALDPLRAATKMYHLNRAVSEPPLSNIERLRQLIDRRGVLHIDATDLQAMSDDDLAAAPALLRTDRKGPVEPLLTDAALRRAFPNRNRFFADREIKAVMRTDKDGRRAVTISVRSNKKQERLYAFSIEQLTTT